jgi:hypothetical protein
MQMGMKNGFIEEGDIEKAGLLLISKLVTKKNGGLMARGTEPMVRL